MFDERFNQDDSAGAIVAVRPVARCAIAVRVATMDDLEFIDGLQKMHTHMVGWFPRKQIEAYVEAGNVLIAEEATERRSDEATEGKDEGSTRCRGGKVSEDDRVTGWRGDKVTGGAGSAASPPHPFTHSPPHATSLGYVIFRDQYMKRDDVGIMYQVNVLPLKQRNLIGAMLVQAVFERAAYGCRLYSLWCAQDIQANWFWESLGFVPLAFRTGSRAKQRIHIFWQRRVRDGDDATPYWFPSQTSGGAVAEDRLVLPIPPGTHWRDAKPVVLPGLPKQEDHSRDGCATKQLPGGAPVRPRPEQPKLSKAERAAMLRSQSRHLQGVPLGKKAVITSSGFKYVDRDDYVPELDDEAAAEKARKPKRPRRPRKKHDPKYMAAARELRDRYLEELNAGNLLPPGAQGKYDVSRQIEGGSNAESAEAERVLRLEA
jgi:GNAT superfamily N-acetyltransferase